MRPGPFIKARYASKADPKKIYPISIKQTSLDLDLDGVKNDSPCEQITEEVSVKVSKNKNQSGISPEKVILKWKEDPPPGENHNSKLTMLNAEIQKKAKIGTVGKYLGKNVVVVSTII